MPDSLLITSDTRRRLQQRYEEAVGLASQPPASHARVHELLAECLRTDPGNSLYLDGLLANMRRWGPKRSGWLVRWFVWMTPRRRANDSQTAREQLSAAPDLLRHRGHDPVVLRMLARAAGDLDFDEVELRYLQEARRVMPDDVQTLRQLARTLTRQGHFEEAVGPWFAVLALAPDAEATQAAEDLKRAVHASDVSLPPGDGNTRVAGEVESSLQMAESLRSQGRLAAADHHLTEAQQAAGGDLRILALREDLRLAHSLERLAIARARAASDPHPKAQTLVGRMESEHNRLAIDILHLRSERHPDDLSLRLELARRLKMAGNYSGAIQRLEETLADPSLAADANLELGECWQHLRQFDKAADFYRQAVAEACRPESDAPAGSPENVSENVPSGDDCRTTLLAALYRLGVLAAAMDQTQEARAAFTRLLTIEPDYKDARQRLDKLP
jgi:tetratricopeptide (TPR) repeat protein